MKQRLYQLTELDVARLEKYAEHNPRFQAMLDTLLERADIVRSDAIKANVVTMNSQITLLDEATQEPATWTIVYPDAAKLELGRLNVFSPVGMALLGTQRGQSVKVMQPSGTEKLMKVAEIVFQPEANGEYTR
ncbi:TPA: GreA/GreB family elongation factor [Burkholderia multivorans]|uniref:GreA/GreB family elongation factor n=1 Tax=Burkholderia multivorans TaxID=87883 RepID=UPI001C24CD71|nr:GreA/GreB family elongation factor [Burkholderia multivorans]MBU9350389.1 GreA/GreB family elongation factor [Burkholderia multivorans]MBU9392683.1 GreA/GreB family elongation factor [Burkholderia multivorans]HDR9834010.1 GreA/GreB family elongation factor [Burkholderia multivorans]HDR9841246.1 GreA/GreB family elongation factor [Burkholderia multivorans]HDR9849283.1 GreA/GreB family elongation factor [Burkholderia multivorans]